MIAQDPQDSVPPEKGSELADLLGAHLAQILERVSRIAEVRAELARRAFLRKAVLIALAGVAGIALATVALLAAWQFGRGLTQGLALLTGCVWLGDLLSGILLLALVFGVAALALARRNPVSSKARERLENEEREAWSALQGSVTQLVREHPYASLGAALAAGFAAAPLAGSLLERIGPLARAALRSPPGIAPSLRRARARTHPTNNAR
jgi:hypothetical protein